MKAVTTFLSGALLTVFILFPSTANAAQSGTLMSSLPNWCTECNVPILMYHYVRVNPNSSQLNSIGQTQPRQGRALTRIASCFAMLRKPHNHVSGTRSAEPSPQFP